MDRKIISTMDKQLIRNYIYNILYQLVKIILPLVTLPYIYKHLTPEYIGIYDAAGSYMNWFILFGIMGVNTYGNREISKVRDNKSQLNRTFFEIFYMQLVNMIVPTIAFFLFCYYMVAEYKTIYYLTGLTMLASMLDITWFFYGIEDFKKASIRNIVVKIIGVTLIILLCKSPADLWKYVVINVVSELIGQGIMFLQLRQYISFEKVSLIDAYRHHFLATFQLFVPTIAISVYTFLDQTMLSGMGSKEQVTYYKTAMGFVKMFLYFITSIGAVMLPRITNVYYNSEEGNSKAVDLIGTTMKIALLLSLPMCFGMIAIAPGFISWFLPTAPIIATLIIYGCPIIVFIAVSNVTGIQYMVPTGMYQLYSASVISGAVINFIINFMLIPRLGAVGAIIGSVVAEFTVTAVQILAVRKRANIHFQNRSYFIYLFDSILMMIVCMLVSVSLPQSFIGTLIQIFIGVVFYFAFLFITKEELFIKFIFKLKGRVKNA